MAFKKETTCGKYQDLLSALGLSAKEANVYETLLAEGQSGIKKLLDTTNHKRGDLYNILYSLRDKGIIEQTLKNRRIEFRALHPNTLANYLNKKIENLEATTSLLHAQMTELLSDYQIHAFKPTIESYEGLEGLEKVHSLLNNSGKKEMFLMRSIYDDDTPEEAELLKKQIKRRIKLGIKVKALTPKSANSLKNMADKDEKEMVERRIIERYRFSLPAQVMIWGNTVAICSMRKTGISTVIEDKDIALTFKTLFNYIWDASAEYHRKIIENNPK